MSRKRSKKHTTRTRKSSKQRQVQAMERAESLKNYRALKQASTNAMTVERVLEKIGNKLDLR